MMTESEARTKWCPFVRFKSAETGSGPAFNRQTVPSGADLNCIGSKCMAWRPESATHGYCGAFGGQSNG